MTAPVVIMLLGLLGVVGGTKGSLDSNESLQLLVTGLFLITIGTMIGLTRKILNELKELKNKTP
ncbi:MAG: hypothetical protein Q8Q95_03930 [bacterium]|nr:hypothetical protein [bacterium]